MLSVGNYTSKFIRKFQRMPELTTATPADDASGYSRINGSKNQSITKPIPLDKVTGEIIVRKATGKIKIRKGQSDDEYQRQLYNYFTIEGGPKRTEFGWMDKEDPIASRRNLDEDIAIKLKRQTLINFCQRLYYRREYDKCAELCTVLIDLFQPINKKNKITKEIQELEYMAEQSRKLCR